MTTPHIIVSAPILTAREMREADRLAVEHHALPSGVLMENAARNAWLELRARIDSNARTVAVLCGSGNNGGDGIALARHALIDGYDVTVWLASEASSPDASLQLAILRSFAPERVTLDFEVVTSRRWSVVVDAMLGTGARGRLREPLAAAVRWMNGLVGTFRCALDLATGLDADTGKADPDAVRSTLTVTMAALKPGLLLGSGPDLAGEIVVVPIGAPSNLYSGSRLALLDEQTARALLPPLHRTRHKYDRGLVVVIGSAPGMRGAGVLTARAALRAGAGVVRLIAPELKESALPWPPLPAELMLGEAEDKLLIAQMLERAASVVVGPGIGRTTSAADLVRQVLENATTPIVLDADGLYPFAGAPERLRERNQRCTLIITPHHGEAARLLGRDAREIGDDPVGTARELAELTSAVAVLKGAVTVVSLPDGRSWIASAGNPGMATGGSGDALAGCIGACVAGCGGVAEGTLLGVHLHGRAGDRAATQHGVNGMIAGDIVEEIAGARRALEESML